MDWWWLLSTVLARRPDCALTLGNYIAPKIIIEKFFNIGQIIGFGKIDSFRSIESILWSIHYPNFRNESIYIPFLFWVSAVRLYSIALHFNQLYIESELFSVDLPKNFRKKFVIKIKLPLSDRRDKPMHYPESPKVTVPPCVAVH